MTFGAQGQIDLSKYLSHDALKVENIIAFIDKKMQGELRVQDIFPSETCADSFTYFKEVDSEKFQDIRRVAEGGGTHWNAREWSKASDTPFRWAEGALISEDQVKYGAPEINYVDEALNTISDKLRLKVERTTLSELQDTTAYTTIGTVNGSNWTAASTATPVDDVVDADWEIQQDESQSATHLILGGSDYKNLITTDQCWQSRMYTRDMIAGTDMYIERFCGKEIVTTIAVYYTAAGTRTALLSAQGILLNRTAARMFVADALSVTRWVDNEPNPPLIKIKASQMLRVKVLKPQLICLLQTLTS